MPGFMGFLVFGPRQGSLADYGGGIKLERRARGRGPGPGPGVTSAAGSLTARPARVHNGGASFPVGLGSPRRAVPRAPGPYGPRPPARRSNPTARFPAAPDRKIDV